MGASGFGGRVPVPVTTFAPITKGHPPFSQYLSLLPFIGLLVPAAFHLQGLYRLRRGRTRVDDFFAVLVGSIVAVLGGIAGTLYVQTYIAPNDRGAYEVSQAVWAVFLALNVALTFSMRQVMREVLERRWRSGVGLRRILIAGSGELEPALRQIASESGIPATFLGFRNQSELPAVYAAADLLVLPSDGLETWGLVVNEAMACGVRLSSSSRTK